MDALRARLAALERVIETRGLVARPAGAPGS
jgi:hypothetical protein